MLQIATLLLALPLAGQHTHELEFTQALLDDAVAKARPAVERALGYAIPEGFAGARVADTDEIEDVLTAENIPVMLAQLGDDELAHDQALAFASTLAPGLLAKFAIVEREILISPDGFRMNAELLDIPELMGEDVVRAVIVHELVHAADIPRHEFAARCVALADAARIQTLNAVLEGHAQHVARAVCAELGLTEALNTYDRAIVGVPTDEGDQGEAMRVWRRIQRQALSAMYVAGESFVAAIDAARGADGVAQAFREPPLDMAEVHQPTWYLDPELRPKTRFDLEAALDRFDEAYAEREWAKGRQSLDSAQLAAAFTGLDEAVIQRIGAALRGGRLSQHIAPGQEAFHMTLACEWATETDAALVVEASRELLKLRDETMKEGMIRILSATYEDVQLGEDGPAGVFASKQVQTPGGKLEVRTLVLRSGALTFELLRSAEIGTKEDFLALAGRVVAAASAPAPAPPAPDASGEEAQEEPPADGTSGNAGG